jgi:hypothetical protein
MLFVCNWAPDNPGPRDASALQGNVDRYDDWFIGCNNLGLCTAITATNHRTTPPIYSAQLVIEFNGDTDSEATAGLYPASKPGIALSPTITRQFMRVLTRDADGIGLLSDNDRQLYEFRAAGFGAALEAIRNWRRAYGKAKFDPKPILTSPVVRLENVSNTTTMARIKKRCPAGQIGAPSLQAWQHEDGTILWRAGCDDEGINPISFWFSSPNLRAPKTRIRFGDAEGDSFPAYNSWLDAATGLVRITHFFGHFEDCGVRRLYGWQNGAMELFEERIMPICGTDLQPENWVNVYSAGTVAVGPKLP